MGGRRAGRDRLDPRRHNGDEVEEYQEGVGGMEEETERNPGAFVAPGV